MEVDCGVRVRGEGARGRDRQVKWRLVDTDRWRHQKLPPTRCGDLPHYLLPASGGLVPPYRPPNVLCQAAVSASSTMAGGGTPLPTPYLPPPGGATGRAACCARILSRSGPRPGLTLGWFWRSGRTLGVEGGLGG